MSEKQMTNRDIYREARRAHKILRNGLTEVAKGYHERIKFIDQELDAIEAGAMQSENSLPSLEPTPVGPSAELLRILDDPLGGL